MNACQMLIDNERLVNAALVMGLLALEAWVGKTDKTEASSLLELLYNIVLNRKPKPLEEKKDDQAL